MSKGRHIILIGVGVAMLSAPWVWGDYTGYVVSSAVVTATAVAFSLASGMIFSWASHTVKPLGITLAVITGASLSAPFLQTLGPVAGMVLGAVAGFAAFQFHMMAIRHDRDRPLILAWVTVTLAYVIMGIIILMVPASPHIWDTGGGIGAWTGTPQNMEPPAIVWDGHAPFLAAITSLMVTTMILRRMR